MPKIFKYLLLKNVNISYKFLKMLDI